MCVSRCLDAGGGEEGVVGLGEWEEELISFEQESLKVMFLNNKYKEMM